MKLAYLLNSYPMTSTTFIRREIAAIEAAGVPVKRFAVRHWGEELVDPADRAEQGRTEYLLTRNMSLLLIGLISEAIARRSVFAKAWAAMRALQAAGGGLIRPIGYLAQAIRLRRRSATLGIDHIHAHFSTNAAAVAMLCRLLGGPRYSFTVHGPDELIAPERNAIALKAEHAAYVFAISEYCRGVLQAQLSERLWRRIALIPCGLDLGEFPQAANRPATGAMLLCVGRLCPQKGQVEIPAAVSVLAERFPTMSVVLIGDGETRGAMETAIAQYGLDDRIRLLGWRDNETVRAMLKDARALLLPSHAEGLPVVIMEAFALERPVITTRIAGIPELVDSECGWLFEAGDRAGLEQAIAAALSADAERLETMGREGRRRVVERHNLATIAPPMIALFARVD